MVDDAALLNTDEVKAQAAAYDALLVKMENAKRKLIELIRTKGEDNEQTKEQRRVITGLGIAMTALGQELGGQTVAFIKTRHASNAYTAELETLKQATAGLNLKSSGWIDTLTRVGGALAAVGLTAVALQSKFVQGVLNPLGSTKDIVAGMPTSFQNLNTVLKGQADLLNLAGRAHLGLGNSMKQGRVTARDMRREIATLQRQYNISAEDQKKFHDTTAHLEGMMGKINKTVSAGGRPMLNTAKIMNTATVAGIKLADVGTRVKDIMEKMGATSGDVSTDFVNFSAAAKAGGLSVEFAREQILKATAPLAIFKKGASEAKDVWAVFAKSLKEEIAPEQIGAIVTSVTQGIAGMNFQTRAFVSQMSGAMRGVSALGGALRMEMNLRKPGGLARNLRMTMQAMQKVTGGGPVTLEEAIRDPSKEMKFQLQRQMVGEQMGVKGEQQQARVLEVMQQIQRGSMTNIDASKELSKITRSGEDLQRASTTAVEKIANMASRRNRVLDRIFSTLDPIVKRMDLLQAGRTGRVEVPGKRVARVAGTTIRSGLREAGGRAPKEMGRLMRTLRDPLSALARGLAGKAEGTARPAGQPVTAAAPTKRIAAEHRMPASARRILAEPKLQQHPELEEVLNRPRETPGPPTDAYPFTPLRRRTEPPTGAPGGGTPARTGAGAAPGTTGAGLTPAGGGEEIAEAGATNITVGVVCAECHKEMVRKSLAELSEQRDQHIQGVVTGNA